MNGLPANLSSAAMPSAAAGMHVQHEMPDAHAALEKQIPYMASPEWSMRACCAFRATQALLSATSARQSRGAVAFIIPPQTVRRAAVRCGDILYRAAGRPGTRIEEARALNMRLIMRLRVYAAQECRNWGLDPRDLNYPSRCSNGRKTEVQTCR